MFSGIIECIGTLKTLQFDILSFEFNPSLVKSKIKIGDSIAINGICFTIFKIKKNIFFVRITEETKTKTILQKAKKNMKINIETPIIQGEKNSGHFVLGHVDCIGKIQKIQKIKKSNIFKISFEKKFKNLVVEKGSIAINGVSLTIFDIKKNSFKFSVVDFSFKNTCFQFSKTGDFVNIEFDILGKYILKKN